MRGPRNTLPAGGAAPAGVGGDESRGGRDYSGKLGVKKSLGG